MTAKFPLLSLAAASFTGCASAAAGPSATPAPGAQQAARSAAGAPSAQILRRTYASAATTSSRGYLLYLPRGYDPSSPQEWPLLLFLHGNGERGDGHGELDYLFVNGPLYEAWVQKRDLPFVIVAPQLPMYGRDAYADYLKNRDSSQIPKRLEAGVPARPPEFATPNRMTGQPEEVELPVGPDGPPMGWPKLEEDVLAILGDVAEHFHVDPTRQYITGVSYGGFGTWYLASRHPNRFAAMAPVVGYGHPDLMPSIAAARIPVWCFAGGRDGVVPAQYFYPGLNRLEELGHDSVRFTIEADMGHDVWARVYAGQDLYDWLLQHARSP